MFHVSNVDPGRNPSLNFGEPLEPRVTYVYLGPAANTQGESIMSGTSVKSHLDAARVEVMKLEHDLEIARVRLETLEMVAEPDGVDGSADGKEHAARRGAGASGFDGQIVRPVVLRGSRSTATAPTPRGNSRAAPGSWARVFWKLIQEGTKQFSYDDVLEAATSIGMDTTKPSVRVRISKFKDQGALERVTDGVYKPTKEGMAFFKQE